MKDRTNEFPRDLRGFMLGGITDDPDGSERVLLFPIRSYYNLWAMCRDLEQEILNSDTPLEDKENYSRILEGVKSDLPALRDRILDQCKERPPKSRAKRAVRDSIKVDRGVKIKVEKALDDIDAGKYLHSKNTKTLKAVRQAMVFHSKNGRMPSHQELMKLGYNDHQATNAGIWLDAQHPNPLFPPLHQATRGPRTKSSSEIGKR